MPQGFRAFVGNVGLRSRRDDFVVLLSQAPTSCSAVFTRSRFAGPSVALSRSALERRSARGVIVLSGNANVATGDEGLADATEVQRLVAQRVGLDSDDLLIASTGSIGRRYPMARLRESLAQLPQRPPEADFSAMAHAIMTKDTKAKMVSLRCGRATITGVAKGVGMIEPDMATLLAFLCTDAAVPGRVLDRIFREVVARTFNAVSLDSDTSTSDTAAVFANGLAGPVDSGQFQDALYEVALDLTKQIARDGEGATKLIEVRVTGARDNGQARRVGKSVINSPRVKTAIHSADADWGRIAAAVGQCSDDQDIDQRNVRISIGGIPAYPLGHDPDALHRMVEHTGGDTVLLQVDLGIADGNFTVYGCDLSAAYVTGSAIPSTPGETTDRGNG